MNVCELRLYNSSGVVISRIGFLASPFSLPENIRIPKAQKRQSEIGNNLFGHGSEIRESKYANAVISLQPTIILESCTDDEAAFYIEQIRSRFEYILDEAQRWSTRRTTNYVRFAEDTKGFILESEIIDGDFDIQDDWSRSNLNSGIIASANLSMVRRPFRLNPRTETIENYVLNPSFEFTMAGVHLNFSGWASNIDSINPTADKVWETKTDSIDGDKSIKLWNSGNNVQTTVTSEVNLTQTITGRTIPANTLLYAEAWVYAAGDPTHAESRMQISDGLSITKNLYWTLGASPTYRDLRWYRSRQDNEEDLSTTREYASKLHFTRKGIFILTTTQVTAPSLGFYIAKTVNGATIEFSMYVDKVYMTDAANFLTPEQLASMKSRVTASGSVSVDPGAVPGDIDWMPKAWGSGGYLNPVYDHFDGTTNYLDIDGVGGDIPAKAEVTLSSTNSGGNERTRMILAGMTSKGLPYNTRSLLTKENTNAVSAVNNYNVLTNDNAVDPIAVNSQSYSTTYQQIFTFSTGVNRNKISGNYRVMARLYVTDLSGNSTSIARIRYAVQIGRNTNNYAYGREIALPATPIDHFIWVDIGTLEIPDLEESTSVYVIVQGRTTAAQIINFYIDAITLIPADEWMVAALAAVPLTASYFIRAGSITGRDNLPAVVGGSSYNNAEYVSGREPFVVPDRVNRIYFALNTVPDDVYSYFVSWKQRNNTAIRLFSKVKYQELYL